MWGDFVAWERQYLLRPEFPLANPEYLAIPHCVDATERATAPTAYSYREVPMPYPQE
jgi:hypothetical protein